jgi:hypothetical protein
MKNLLLFAALAFYCSSLSLAQESSSSAISLSKFSLGAHISGDEVDLSKMSGKVVAIEYWGTR